MSTRKKLPCCASPCVATAREGGLRRPEPLVWGLLAFAWLLPLHAVTIAYLFGGLAWPAGLVRAVAAWKEALVVTLLACVLLRALRGRGEAHGVQWLDLAVAGLAALAGVYL